jgi:hypothetical protein
MRRESQNKLNNSQMDLVMQRMIEAHTQLTQVVTQNMISSKSNELPPGVQQLLDAHTHIVQMASRINNNVSPSDPSNDKPEEHVVTRNQACKLCGDIGHISKECEEQCHSCGRDHCNEECRLSRVTCLLCEGTNHVLAECNLNAMVDKVNQQIKQKLHQSLGKAGAEFEPKEAKHFVTTKRNNPSGRLQVTKNNRKKREKFPTIIKEYEKQELEDLLALEKPKNKKGINQVGKDLSLVTCYKCGNKGHYANKCPEKYRERQ